MTNQLPAGCNYSKIGYFRHLNAMRFIAAFLVLVHHAEQIRLKEGLSNFKDLSVANFGYDAVVFFFVLSGFLITYLLLREQKEHNKISIKRFYQRRIVRIWPLYFILVILGLWVVPTAIHLLGYPYTMPYTAGESLPYFVFFMPFMVNILYGHSMLEPLWSIGVEELFYLWWAPAVKWFRKHLLTLLLTVISLKYLLLTLIYYHVIEVSPITSQVIGTLMFEAMAIGGLSAWLLFRTKQAIGSKPLFSRWSQLIVLLFVAGRIFAHQWLCSQSGLFDVLYNTPIISSFLMIVAYAYLIVAISVGEDSIAGQKEARWLSKLGEISYGIYMYHMLVIFGVILLTKPFLATTCPIISTSIFYLLVIGGTIGTSWLSKRFIEDRFLKFKKY